MGDDDMNEKSRNKGKLTIEKKNKNKWITILSESNTITDDGDRLLCDLFRSRANVTGPKYFGLGKGTSTTYYSKSVHDMESEQAYRNTIDSVGTWTITRNATSNTVSFQAETSTLSGTSITEAGCFGDGYNYLDALDTATTTADSGIIISGLHFSGITLTNGTTYRITWSYTMEGA
jgi:hypothetical protein